MWKELFWAHADVPPEFAFFGVLSSMAHDDVPPEFAFFGVLSSMLLSWPIDQEYYLKSKKLDICTRQLPFHTGASCC